MSSNKLFFNKLNIFKVKKRILIKRQKRGSYCTLNCLCILSRLGLEGRGSYERLVLRFPREVPLPPDVLTRLLLRLRTGPINVRKIKWIEEISPVTRSHFLFVLVGLICS